MFIALYAQPCPAAFGVAELNLAGTRLVSFRRSERRRNLHYLLIYKHLTPTE